MKSIDNTSAILLPPFDGDEDGIIKNALKTYQSNRPLHLFPVLPISIDGPDGAGKSTIVQFLRDNFFCIQPPHFIELGLMPQAQKERISWYQTADPFANVRTYLTSHQKRFELLDAYDARTHYKQIGHKRPFVLWDRGPLSAQAYAFAMLKINTHLPDDVIRQFIRHSFQPTIPFLTIDLYADIQNTEKFLSRAKHVVDQDIEFKLIEGQINFYQNAYTPLSPLTLKLDPFTPAAQNFRYVEHVLQTILSIEGGRSCTTKPPRAFLVDVCKKLLRTSRSGAVHILGYLA